jgi:phosphomannomutase
MTSAQGRRPVDRLLAEARAWRTADPDPSTRAQIEDVIRRADEDELGELFGDALRFGTAGLRAPLGPGPRRMNRLVVRRCIAAVAAVLHDAVPGAEHAGVVVGHDARHGSESFAGEATAVLRSAGFQVHRFDAPVPTPLVAFALRHLGAAAAVMVTASHNPASDNGLKVYWADGAQIIPPIDGRIAEAMRSATPATGPRRTAHRPAALHPLGGTEAGSPVVAAYLADALMLEGRRSPRRPRPLAMTSLHGVGGALVELVLDTAGHGPIHHVASQRQPDADFPTLAFPNPEEPGAMDAVVELATTVGASLAIANDPDADRLALAAPTTEGSWRRLTGDQVGVLLAHHLLRDAGLAPDRLLVTTVVSSRMLAAMAASAGVHHAETLTGFKWLCRPALEQPARHQLLAYEEALGYAIGERTRDKDGITAALVAADMVCRLDDEGRTVWDVLDELDRAHGAHVTRNGAMRPASPREADELLRAASELVAAPPTRLGGIAVVTGDQPSTGTARWFLQDRTRVLVRPSGTEAKLKYYLEAIEEVHPGEPPGVARGRARVRLVRVEAELRRLLAGG